jgi:hypothetical protein
LNLNNHLVCSNKELRDIFLMSQPLLLYQGGEPPASQFPIAGNSQHGPL